MDYILYLHISLSFDDQYNYLLGYPVKFSYELFSVQHKVRNLATAQE